MNCWDIRVCSGSKPLHRREGNIEPSCHAGLDAQHPGHQCVALQGHTRPEENGCSCLSLR